MTHIKYISIITLIELDEPYDININLMKLVQISAWSFAEAMIMQFACRTEEKDMQYVWSHIF